MSQAEELQEQILKRNSLRKTLVKDQKKALEDFDDETTRLQNKLELLIQSNNPQINAAEKWCRLTNALISKYKHMAEENPNRAIEEITRIEGALITGGFLTEQELEEAL